MKNKEQFKRQLKTLAPYAIAAVFLALPVLGFCAGDDAEMEKVSSKFQSIIFSNWLKAIFLTAGIAKGARAVYKTGELSPLGTWGGAGLAFAFAPNFVSYLLKLTA